MKKIRITDTELTNELEVRSRNKTTVKLAHIRTEDIQKEVIKRGLVKGRDY